MLVISPGHMYVRVYCTHITPNIIMKRKALRYACNIPRTHAGPIVDECIVLILI